MAGASTGRGGFDGPEGRWRGPSPTLVEFLLGGSRPIIPQRSVRSRGQVGDVAWKVAGRLGGTRDVLPFEYEFLVTEAEARRIEAAYSRHPEGRFSGPICEDWLTLTGEGITPTT